MDPPSKTLSTAQGPWNCINVSGATDKLSRCVLRDLSCTWQDIPSYIRYDVASLSIYESNVVLVIRHAYTDYLYTQFLLLNLLVNAGEPEQERLIATAREILHLVLLPARNRDMLYARKSDIEWTVSRSNCTALHSSFRR